MRERTHISLRNSAFLVKAGNIKLGFVDVVILRKFQLIENLKLVPNLYKLNLSHNCISKISNLECLSHLSHLDLAYNLISSMDGLQTLTGLLTLNLRGNQISSIPTWIKHCLVSLKTLNLADNRINSLHQLLRLRGLDSLTSLSFHGNPAVEDLVMTASSDNNNSESELSRPLDAQIQQDSRSLIYRLFTLFHLRTLARLDGEPVKPEEIRKAIERFSQVEMDHTLRKLQQRETDLDKLERANLDLVRGLDTQYRMVRAAQQDQEMHLSKINRLEQELQAKDAMLASQTDELARACLKHYELEQELAFHKIDNKFAQFLLGPRPQVNQSDLQKIEATGDHPYVGRCRTRWAPQGQTSEIEGKTAEEERRAAGPLQSLFKPASLDSHLMRAGSGCAQRVLVRPNNSRLGKEFSSLCVPVGRPSSLPLRPTATDSGIAGSIASPAPVERPQTSSPTGNLSSSLEEVERLTKSIVERTTLAPLSPQTERTRQLTEKALSGLKSQILNSIREPINTTETTSTLYSVHSSTV
ncbi:Centriolin [Clonorchis sinensis]|uniref:Centriolin n=1 Tax=Clonorchis sinensis TaxID=79923 RepID=A0A8T1N2D9_CLOSI|nr:Centriolin [Clonorchis sinensis]